MNADAVRGPAPTMAVSAPSGKLRAGRPGDGRVGDEVPCSLRMASGGGKSGTERTEERHEENVSAAGAGHGAAGRALERRPRPVASSKQSGST